MIERHWEYVSLCTGVELGLKYGVLVGVLWKV